MVILVGSQTYVFAILLKVKIGKVMKKEERFRGTSSHEERSSASHEMAGYLLSRHAINYLVQGRVCSAQYLGSERWGILNGL